MKALVYTAERKVEIEDRPRIAPGPGEVEIAIELAGICGSDVSGFLGHSARRKPRLVLGHELVGRLSNGQRVVANPLISCQHCTACLSGAQNLCSSWRLLGMDQLSGSFAEFVSLPEMQVYEIPEFLPSTRAILTEPLANIVHLFRIAHPDPFFRLAIVGAGTMGALALSVSRLIGASETVMLDVNQQRLNNALTLGATAAVNTAAEDGVAKAGELAGHGFDLVLDASGISAARQMAFDLCRPGGQVVLLGMGHQRSEVDFVTSIRKEHRITMSFAYTPADFERALALLIAGKIDLKNYTASYPLEQGQEAFEELTLKPSSKLKIVLGVS